MTIHTVPQSLLHFAMLGNKTNSIINNFHVFNNYSVMHTHGRTITGYTINIPKPMPIHTMHGVDFSLLTLAGYFWRHILKSLPNVKSSICPTLAMMVLLCGRRNITNRYLRFWPSDCPYWYRGISGTKISGFLFGQCLIWDLRQRWTLHSL